jgi:DNA invertase Pin-like site-specific DNA recombinase
MIRTGRVARGSFLLVEHLDRLSREKPMIALGLMQSIVEAGVTIVTTTDGQVYSSETLNEGFSLFHALIELMGSHRQSARKSELVGKAWAAKRVRARTDKVALSRICPGWLEKAGDSYRIIPERAEIIREIFNRLADGEGAPRIAKDLNARGVPTWGHRKPQRRALGKPTGVARWHASYIQKMRTGQAVIGHGEIKGGEIIRDFYPPVISEQAYWSARLASEARRISSARNRGEKVTNLIQGLGRCGRCGSTMVYRDKGERSSGPFLQCKGVSDGTGCDNRHKWRYAKIESGLPFLIGQAGRTRIVEAIDPSRSLADRLSAARIRLDEAERRWKTFLALVDDAPGETAKAELKARDAALTEARAALAELEGEAAVTHNRTVSGTDLMKEVAKMARGSTKDRLLISQRLVEVIERITFDGRSAEIRLRNGGRAQMADAGDPPRKPNRGWFTDGRNKLGDGTWKSGKAKSGDGKPE